jgi:hypothetical protein
MGRVPNFNEWTPNLLRRTLTTVEDLGDLAGVLVLLNDVQFTKISQRLCAHCDALRRYYEETVRPWWDSYRTQVDDTDEEYHLTRGNIIQLARLLAAVDGLIKTSAVTVKKQWHVTLNCCELSQDNSLGLAESIIPPPVEEACRRLFYEQSVELIAAVRRCLRPIASSSTEDWDIKIRDALREANRGNILGLQWPMDRALDGSVIDRDPVLLLENEEFLSENETVVELFGELLPGDDLEKRHNQLQQWSQSLSVISLKDWDGEIKYPVFQFDEAKGVASGAEPLDRMKPVVRYVLDGLVKSSDPTKHPLSGWKLAVYVRANLARGRDEPWFEEQLKGQRLWQNFNPSEAHGPMWQRVKSVLDSGHLLPLPMKGEYYRITGKKYAHPYHYSHFDDNRGRYDPGPPDDPETDCFPDYGALYLGESPLDCWAEVLGRQPIVTLSFLASQVQYAIWVEPNDFGEVPECVDLTPQDRQLLDADRTESNAIARLMLERGYDGIRYGMAVTGTQAGIALFAPWPRTNDYPDQACDHSSWPDSCEVAGKWNPPAPTDWYDCPALWSYLNHNWPVGGDQILVLRRFPDDPAPEETSAGEPLPVSEVALPASEI